MTTTLKQQQEDDQPLMRRLDSDYVTHFLSLIGIAAHSTNYEPFTYTLAGCKVRLGTDIVKELHQITLKQEAIYDELLGQVRSIQIETNGEYAEFLSTPISDIGLSTRTYHGLKGSGDCRIMLDVAKVGSYGVSRLRMLGSKSVDEIRKVFIKAGCVELFDTEKP